MRHVDEPAGARAKEQPVPSQVEFDEQDCEILATEAPARPASAGRMPLFRN
jgi:hypothetical protein